MSKVPRHLLSDLTAAFTLLNTLIVTLGPIFVSPQAGAIPIEGDHTHHIRLVVHATVEDKGA